MVEDIVAIRILPLKHSSARTYVAINCAFVMLALFRYIVHETPLTGNFRTGAKAPYHRLRVSRRLRSFRLA